MIFFSILFLALSILEALHPELCVPNSQKGMWIFCYCMFQGKSESIPTFDWLEGTWVCTKCLHDIRSKNVSRRGQCDQVLPWALKPVPLSLPLCPLSVTLDGWWWKAKAGAVDLPRLWSVVQQEHILTICFKYSKISQAKQNHIVFTPQTKNLTISPLHKHKKNIRIYQRFVAEGGCIFES